MKLLIALDLITLCLCILVWERRVIESRRGVPTRAEREREKAVRL